MMMTYDVACPICGRINRSLYLEETAGWMECECCGNFSEGLSVRKRGKIPVCLMHPGIKRMSLKLKTAAAQ